MAGPVARLRAARACVSVAISLHESRRLQNGGRSASMSRARTDERVSTTVLFDNVRPLHCGELDIALAWSSESRLQPRLLGCAHLWSIALPSCTAVELDKSPSTLRTALLVDCTLGLFSV